MPDRDIEACLNLILRLERQRMDLDVAWHDASAEASDAIEALERVLDAKDFKQARAIVRDALDLSPEPDPEFAEVAMQPQEGRQRYRPGDVLLCTDGDEAGDLKAGQVYRVVGATSGGMVMFAGKSGHWFYQDRFRLERARVDADVADD